MNKKIILALTLIVIAASVTAVSAFSLDDLAGGSSEPEKITIDGIDFQVPDGFTEDHAYESVNETSSQGGIEYTFNQKLFENDKNESVSILVGDYGEYKVTDDVIQVIADEKKTISGIDGFTAEDSGIYIFAYAKNDKLVVLTSSEDDLFDQFLIAE